MQTSMGHVAYGSEQEASDSFNERLNNAVEVIEVKSKVNKLSCLIPLAKRRHHAADFHW
jgi:hypothetical protein